MCKLRGNICNKDANTYKIVKKGFCIIKFNTEIHSSRLSDRSAILQIFNTGILYIKVLKAAACCNFSYLPPSLSPYLPSYQLPLAFLSHPSNLSIPSPFFPSSILSQVISGKWRLKRNIKREQELTFSAVIRTASFERYVWCLPS